MTVAAQPSRVKRIRRTPEEARRLILDAAEASLGLEGPGGLRLKDVARAAGVAHPTILHHFGNREGLIQALNQRALAALKATLVGMMAQAQGPMGALELAFAAYRDGLAQRMMWLAQSDAHVHPHTAPIYGEIVEALHAMRVRLSPPGVEVDRYDSAAVVRLVTLAAFADALIGPRLRQYAGEDDEAEARARFERWLAAMLTGYLASQATA